MENNKRTNNNNINNKKWQQVQKCWKLRIASSQAALSILLLLEKSNDSTNSTTRSLPSLLEVLLQRMVRGIVSSNIIHLG